MFSSSLLSTREPDYIRPNRLIDYLKLLSEAQQYEKRYLTVGDARKKQLAGPLKAIINKLRDDTLTTLTTELLAFLNGQEQLVLTQVVRISTEEGKEFLFHELFNCFFSPPLNRTFIVFINDCISGFQSIAWWRFR